ncbi:HD domain-containing protein [Arcobacter nitrofigilis]|uniref:HD domain-containing protein n=1 Tax=Arcobacter nitrofigilis TaxID=28199 RepID=UPI001CBC4304|nr:HD domain-containing protein [Arcobacter nitrofigilis]
MQFVTQNALAYFSFPSITTKRFIHCLGTMHVSSYMLKNALLNSDSSTRDIFLRSMKKVIHDIIVEDELNITFDEGNSYFDNKALYQFSIPTNSKIYNDTYIITLQAVRLAGLLHDVGHLPFSHQVENALKRVYENIQNTPDLLQKEENFKDLYEGITSNQKQVLHEAIGENFIDLLFKEELIKNSDRQSDIDYFKLLHKLCMFILKEKVYGKFDFKVLHSIISGTIDADRLDYINRDMVASGYIGGANDNLRITKHTVLVRDGKTFKISFFDMGLIDIEHLLEMRFNLYKKVIYNHGIAKTDALLENVVLYLSKKYFKNGMFYEKNSSNCIAMLWNFLSEKNEERRLDIVSMLDENWLISLFKKEYFEIKNKDIKTNDDKKYLKSFEEVLFGKRFFRSPWKNLNEFYKVLEFSTIERYKFRESFGYLTKNRFKKLRIELDKFIKKWETQEEDVFFTYQIVSFTLGLNKEFTLYDGEEIIPIDEISTVRKRLKKSMLNTVPFYIYTNKKEMNLTLKKELKDIVFKIFED